MIDQASTDELAGPSTEPGGQVASSVPETDGTDVWAVCCSGGGIRSASYCLGALQALDGAGFLDKARLILGVSGGGYMAASRALVAHGLESGAGVADANALPAYAPGSPEEQHLRRGTALRQRRVRRLPGAGGVLGQAGPAGKHAGRRSGTAGAGVAGTR